MTEETGATAEISMFMDGRMNTINAAKYVGLSIKTLACTRSTGTGPPYTKRGRVFYYKEDLDAWLRGGTRLSTTQRRTR